jgi:hypothetical protein
MKMFQPTTTELILPTSRGGQDILFFWDHKGQFIYKLYVNCFAVTNSMLYTTGLNNIYKTKTTADIAYTII